MSLQGKISVVVGGAHGLGKAIVQEIASKGASIAVCDLDFDEAIRVVEKIESDEGKAIPIRVDVTNNGQIDAMRDTISKIFKRIDIFVYSAGVYTPLQRITEISEEEFDKVMDVNFKGFFLCCKAVVPEMIRNRSGKIVSISSMSGLYGKRSFFTPIYGASKAALILFTKSIARELAPYNINVNTICPTIIWTDMGRKAAHYIGRFSTKKGNEGDFQKYRDLSPQEVFEKFVSENIPLKRAPTPDDIAKIVLFLVSESSRNITGQALEIDGGADA